MRVGATLRLKLRPSPRAERSQRGDVALADRLRLGKRLDRALDARLAQQVQRRVRRAVGRVAEVVCVGIGKLVLRVKARHLQHAVEAEVFERGIGCVEKIVELGEIDERIRVDQQRGLDDRRVAVVVDGPLGTIAPWKAPLL